MASQPGLSRMTPRPFQSVAAAVPRRSTFDLSHRKTFTCDMGQLIPIVCDEAVPGDVFDISNEVVIRFNPLVAPLMHEINARVEYYFVPYRILWEDWESFITGGFDGQDASVLPRWVPTNVAVGSLWDYLGFPLVIPPGLSAPMDMPRRAYNRIYNEYYRDETLTAEVVETNESILNRAWEKDYFTSALPWQQRGTAPSLPISGTTHAVWAADFAGSFVGTDVRDPSQTSLHLIDTNGSGAVSMSGSPSASRTLIPSGSVNIPKSALDANTVDLSSATTFNVADLRLAIQVQRWLERNARAGVRYTEFLQAHYGVSPRDERLQRPEFLGGLKSPVVISEVLQTGQTTTGAGGSPQANMAGHGLVADHQYVSRYHVAEFGVIMAMFSVMPRTQYSQGINRQWLRRSKYDFYSPEFANLSEQAIEREEIYASAVEADNRAIWGYQGRFDEMRFKPNQVMGLMRSGVAGSFDYWNMARVFAAAPALNSSFVVSDPTKRVFAVTSQPGLICTVGNRIHAIRPMPIEAEPGLMDHV